MSANATLWAWVCGDVPRSSIQLVLINLCSHANNDGNAWPTVQTISRETKLNRKSVMSAIEWLTQHQAIKFTGMHKGRTGRVNVYRVNVPTLQRPPKKGELWSLGEDRQESLIVPKTDTNGTENGTVKWSQKRYLEQSGITIRNPSGVAPNAGAGDASGKAAYAEASAKLRAMGIPPPKLKEG